MYKDTPDLEAFIRYIDKRALPANKKPLKYQKILVGHDEVPVFLLLS